MNTFLNVSKNNYDVMTNLFLNDYNKTNIKIVKKKSKNKN